MARKEESESLPSIIETPKQKKSGTTTMNRDRISSLPDSLLCHILSFLATGGSVATSVLSRRWRHLWKDLQVLDFSDRLFFLRGPFVPSVNTVLAQRSLSHVKSFRLSCDVSGIEDSVTAWIRAATAAPYLQDLYLRFSHHNLYFDETCEIEEFGLPDEVFTCTSLVSLTLEGEIYLRSLSSVHLPSLKNLELDIGFVDPDKVLSGCPVLETLMLSLCRVNFPAIHMPHSLKSLTFDTSKPYGVIEHLEIDTPHLEYIHIMLRCRCSRILVSNFPGMLKAHLDIFPGNENVGWVPELLRSLRKTKSLVLKDSTIECLIRAPALAFPGFCCLLYLELDVERFNSRFQMGLLHNCHMLEVLKIHNHYSACQGLFFGYPLQHGEPSGLTLPTSVPNCVISQLKTFEFKGYQDSADEHAFTAYLLQRGLVLETMTIHTNFGSDQKKKYDSLKEFTTIPRGSTTCQLKVG